MSAVTLRQEGDIAVITIDDGKANALSFEVLRALNSSLDEVDGEREVRAVVLAGRPGMLSGGFDLNVMRGGDVASIADLVTTGGELVLRLLSSPKPVVCACTGHAVAAGALVALGAHFRVGADGDYRIGLIETAIGLVLPDWAVVIADERLSRRHVQQAVVEARVYGPHEAKDAGFLDVVVAPEETVKAAVAEAARLGGLDPTAYAGNLAKLRGPGIDRLRAAVVKDRTLATGAAQGS
jgi:enoyl-CoA hydratase